MILFSTVSRTLNDIFGAPWLILNEGTGEMSTDASLRTIQVLLTNTDPSPHLISTLSTPIVPSLYALYVYLEGTKASDPLLRESLKGYLETWGRLVGSTEVISTLWRIIDGEGGTWHVDIAGTVSRTEEYVFTVSPLTSHSLTV